MDKKKKTVVKNQYNNVEVSDITLKQESHLPDADQCTSIVAVSVLRCVNQIIMFFSITRTLTCFFLFLKLTPLLTLLPPYTHICLFYYFTLFSLPYFSSLMCRSWFWNETGTAYLTLNLTGRMMGMVLHTIKRRGETAEAETGRISNRALLSL